jgi:hypothetical protein
MGLKALDRDAARGLQDTTVFSEVTLSLSSSSLLQITVGSRVLVVVVVVDRVI